VLVKDPGYARLALTAELDAMRQPDMLRAKADVLLRAKVRGKQARH